LLDLELLWQQSPQLPQPIIMNEQLLQLLKSTSLETQRWLAAVVEHKHKVINCCFWSSTHSN
jgi:hypothetical protein